MEITHIDKKLTEKEKNGNYCEIIPLSIVEEISTLTEQFSQELKKTIVFHFPIEKGGMGLKNEISKEVYLALKKLGLFDFKVSSGFMASFPEENTLSFDVRISPENSL